MPNNTPEEKTWRERFDELFLFPNKVPPIVDLDGNEYLHRVDYGKIKAFISKEIASAKAEGRREAAKKIEHEILYNGCENCSDVLEWMRRENLISNL